MPESRSNDAGGAPVAETDLLGEAATQRGPIDQSAPSSPEKDPPAGAGNAAPGLDENQAGFIKDRDKRDQP